MYTFNKEERLCSKRLIEQLFSEGHSFTVFPFRCIWLEVPLAGPWPAQAAISVSKRNFKKAVDRNKIKRRIRESYRKNKSILYNFLKEKDKTLIFTLVYIARTSLPYAEVEGKIILTLQRFGEEYEKSGR